MNYKLQNRTPQIRFPEFQGEWKDLIFNEFLIFTPRPISKPSNNYLSIGIRSHFKGTFQKPNTDPTKNVMDTLYMVKENDFLVNITFAWEGALAIVPKEDEGGLVSHRFPTYIFNKEKVKNIFFKYSFFREKSKHQLGIVSPGGAGRNRVMNKKDFLKLRLPFPTLPEQKRIAHFFTVLDNKINQLKEKKALLEEYKKGMMQKIFAFDKKSMVNGKISKENYQLNTPELRFFEFGGESADNSYNKYIFEEIFLFSTGKNIKQSEASPDYEIPCIRYGELYYMYDEVIYKIVNRTNIDKSELLFSKGDEILLPSAGEDPLDIGSASALTLENIAIGRTINILRPIKDSIYSQEYVAYYINQKLKKKISTLAKGSSISNVYNSDLKKLEIILPSFLEQTKIANFLSKIDDKIKTVNEQIEETKEYKKGMLQMMYVN